MKAQTGSARRKFLAFLPFLALALYIGGYAFAQSVGNDPCSIYPHRSAFIPVGTPTQKLVAGALGYEIDVCRVSVENISAPGGTPVTETFYSGGEANASGTPCATSTTGAGAVATVSIVAAAATTIQVGGDGNHTLYHVAPVSAGFPVDFCGLMSGGTGLGGSIDFVMVKP